MVDFLTKPLLKNAKKKQLLKGGVTLKTPDIKITMNVCTPLNKVFGFQESNILVVEAVSQFLS